MPVLKILKVHCYDITDSIGDDDLYIEIDGVPFWGGDETEIGSNQTLIINKDWQFTENANVQIFDWDQSGHDLIGTLFINLNTPINVELSTHMYGHSSHYEVFYKIS